MRYPPPARWRVSSSESYDPVRETVLPPTILSVPVAVTAAAGAPWSPRARLVELTVIESLPDCVPLASRPVNVVVGVVPPPGFTGFLLSLPQPKAARSAAVTARRPREVRTEAWVARMG